MLQNTISLLLIVLVVFILSACTTKDRFSTHITNATTYNCTTSGYYNILSGSQVYHYVYNTGDNRWTVEIPELCVKLMIENKKYGLPGDDVRDSYRKSGIIREGNVVQQNPLSQEMINKLIEKFPNEELYLDDSTQTSLTFFSINEKGSITGSILDRWGTFLPALKCNIYEGPVLWDGFVDTGDLIQYDGENKDTTDIKDGCFSAFAYRGEKRWVVPFNYPQGTFDFFAPKIQFTDR